MKPLSPAAQMVMESYGAEVGGTAAITITTTTETTDD
jgi:hypothetical protein